MNYIGALEHMSLLTHKLSNKRYPITASAGYRIRADTSALMNMCKTSSRANKSTFACPGQALVNDTFPKAIHVKGVWPRRNIDKIWKWRFALAKLILCSLPPWRCRLMRSFSMIRISPMITTTKVRITTEIKATHPLGMPLHFYMLLIKTRKTMLQARA